MSNVPEVSNRADDNLELGRRLVAALLGYHYGLASDCSLKRYIPGEVYPFWDALAHELLDAMILQVRGETIKRWRN